MTLRVTRFDPDLQVKGTAVAALLHFVDRELTAEQKAGAFAELKDEHRDLLSRSVILAVQTFPVEALNRLTEAAARQKGDDVHDFARRAGHAGAAEAVKGVFRMLAAMLTPTSLISKAGRLWASIYSRGTLTVEQKASGHAIVHLRDFPVEAVCCSRITGWVEEMSSMTRVKNVNVRHAVCFARGGEECAWEVRWS